MESRHWQKHVRRILADLGKKRILARFTGMGKFMTPTVDLTDKQLDNIYEAIEEKLGGQRNARRQLNRMHERMKLDQRTEKRARASKVANDAEHVSDDDADNLMDVEEVLDLVTPQPPPPPRMHVSSPPPPPSPLLPQRHHQQAVINTGEERERMYSIIVELGRYDIIDAFRDKYTITHKLTAIKGPYDIAKARQVYGLITTTMNDHEAFARLNQRYQDEKGPPEEEQDKREPRSPPPPPPLVRSLSSSSSSSSSEEDVPNYTSMSNTTPKAVAAAAAAPRVSVQPTRKKLLPAHVKRPRPPRRKRRANGMAALRQIHKYQRSVDLLIPKASFARLVREVAVGYKSDMRMTTTAVAALQEAAEAHLVGILDSANLCAIHTHRVTVMPVDIQLVRRIHRESQ
jgi:histone H3